MSDTAEVTAAEAARWNALLAADVRSLEALLDDDMAYTHSNGAVDTKSALIDRLASGTLRYVALDPSDHRVRIHADAAVVTGHVVLTTRVGDQPQLVTPVRFTAVWVRRASGWRHVAWHSSPAPA